MSLSLRPFHIPSFSLSVMLHTVHCELSNFILSLTILFRSIRSWHSIFAFFVYKKYTWNDVIRYIKNRYIKNRLCVHRPYSHEKCVTCLAAQRGKYKSMVETKHYMTFIWTICSMRPIKYIYIYIFWPNSRYDTKY